MKKLVFLMFVIAFTLCMDFPAAAAKVIGYTVYTDIIASVNDYNILSYNYNGYTVIVAEDLKDYGFDVKWNAEERALYIERHSSDYVSSTYIAPEISKSQVGKRAYDVLETDIKTYIEGELVASYNINGHTIINFEELDVYGEVSYYNGIRRLDLDISDGLHYKIGIPEPDSKYSPSGLYFKKNSVDGIQVRWFARNNTNKTIHYYTATYYMFNPVMDPAYDDFGGDEDHFTTRVVGPIAPGERLLNFTGDYEPEIYSRWCSYIYLYSIEVEYSDGSEETIYYRHVGNEEKGKFIL